MPEKGISPNLQEIYFESASRGLNGDTIPRCGLKNLKTVLAIVEHVQS